MSFVDKKKGKYIGSARIKRIGYESEAFTEIKPEFNKYFSEILFILCMPVLNETSSVFTVIQNVFQKRVRFFYGHLAEVY